MEADLLQPLRPDGFVFKGSELKAPCVVRMEDQKQGGETVGDQQRSVVLVRLDFTDGLPGLVQTQLAAGIGENDQVVVGGVDVALHLAIPDSFC